jgi:alkanesulfonate monooxygenase SsuD/methylene tetrahydromethanopterin reductase-like flavin-dependent oxidoreductase (luciferase family)
MIGALGPKMFGLAGEIAAGVITVFNTAEATPALLADLHAGARAGGRDPGALEVVSKLFVAIDEDEGALRAALRRLLTGYGTVPAYNALLARQGYEREAAAMASAWADGRRGDALAAVTDELLERLFVFGSAADCARRLEQYAAAGVTTVLVAPMTVAAEAHPRWRGAGERRERILHTVELLAARLGARAPAGHA